MKAPRHRKPKIQLEPCQVKPVLSWRDIATVHAGVRSGLYRSEQEIWQAEADRLNKIIEKQYNGTIDSKPQP